MNFINLKLLLVLMSILFPSILIAQERQIFLVRHAEKQNDGTRDPSLTEKGILRSNNIADMLKNEEIIKIYSSPYKRTKETATPLANLLKLEVMLYDPSDLEAFAKQIKIAGGNILIVGHSNTTPELSQLLGGKSFGKIAEMEYNRVYRLSVNGKKVTSQLLYSSAFRK